MLNNEWLRSELIKLLNLDENNENVDVLLSELVKHSLKLITFLARFNREYGKNPEILEFLKSPTVETLRVSLVKE